MGDNKRIHIIYGRHVNGSVYAWRVDGTCSADIGDYAIVESCDSYSIVEIIGIGMTDEKHIKVLANGKPVNKKALMFVERRMIELAEKNQDSTFLVFSPRCKEINEE